MWSFMCASNWKIEFHVFRHHLAIVIHLILLGEGLVTALLGALVVGAVLSGKVPPANDHDRKNSIIDGSFCEKSQLMGLGALLP